MATVVGLFVWDESGAFKGAYASTGASFAGIESFDSFSVDAAGGSLEATWTAAPSLMTAPAIVARDRVTLGLYDDGGALVYRWRGIVTQAGNPRAPGLQKYRAVGMKRRFYELAMDDYQLAGGDVGTVVRNVLSGMTLPAGVFYDAGGIPLQTFQVGIRYPGLETVGDFLDAMAASVPAFVVPGGDTYTYDGVVYTAGQTVPATMWGVNGFGYVHFWRPRATAATATESAAGTVVDWKQISGEEQVDTVRLVYATGLDTSNLRGLKVAEGGLVLPIDPAAHPPAPITRIFGSGAGATTATRTERVVRLENPLDFMAKAPVDVSIPALGGTWSGTANAVDGNDTTYASTTGYGTLRFTVGNLSAVVLKYTGIWRIKLRVQDLTDDYSNSIMVRIARTAFASTDYTNAWYRVPAEGVGSDVEFYIVAAPFHQESVTYPHDEAYVDVTVTGTATAARIYLAEYYVPDGDTVDTGGGAVALGTASERIAAAYERAPTDEAAAVTIYGIRDATQTLTLTPRAGGSLSLPVERTEYRVTRDEGAVTVFHVGQAWDASLEAERAVLERLARRAVTEGGPTR